MVGLMAAKILSGPLPPLEAADREELVVPPPCCAPVPEKSAGKTLLALIILKEEKKVELILSAKNLDDIPYPKNPHP